MGTPRRAYPSLSPYSLSDTHITASQQSPTFHYDSNDRQRLYTPSEHHYSSYSNNPRVRTSADTSTSKQSSSMGMLNSGLGVEEGGSGTMKRTNKTHVPSACINCKRAHLACDGRDLAKDVWPLEKWILVLILNIKSAEDQS
ncbi:hypothetical protein RhiirA4_395480 [Rhizophagus irregularis]|uniref:Zn(2)-C6 fungal-type domain-containing protein n=1 Tax=Rhizophagus irregularis TaxID=588596 RepID=A0A2I1G354_9GLOM|nr:hypothetical protein RhiirA4_395480 [Rhizophagus irregularis]